MFLYRHESADRWNVRIVIAYIFGKVYNYDMDFDFRGGEKVKTKEEDKNRFVFLAFLIPFGLMTLVFAIMRVSPFGAKQILVTDLWHQYYPFLVDFQDKLKNGESLFWSWTQGGGVNYFALISYYLASPVNFLSVFIPVEFLREFLMFTVAMRIALAGMFMAIFLRSVYRRNDFSLVLFGSSFSFCAFFMGYYWNTIWLDAVCLTPLVVLGAVKLLTENKFRLYVVSLGISLLANYYVGFFTCIFMLLVFICYSIVKWENARNFLKNLLKMGAFSLLSIGMTAFLLLPVFLALSNTYASASEFPRSFAINIGGSNDLPGLGKAFVMVLSNLISFQAPGTAAYEGLPNIACGTGVLFLAILFLVSKDVSRKEKLTDVCLVVFLIFSFIIRQLDYIWHGLHFTNMVPYRFSYLLSFVLVTMAFRAFVLLEKISWRQFVSAFLGASFILALAIGSGKEGYAAAGTAAVVFLICAVVLLHKNRIFSRRIFMILMSFLMLTECGVTAYLGVKTTKVTTTENYPKGGADAAKIVEKMKQLEAETPEMWRAEVTEYQTLNDASLNKYRGLSMFNSMSNVNMTRFFENMGLMGWKAGNRYTYAESSPVANVFMNLKYLIARDDAARNTYDLSEIVEEGSVKLYKNEHYLPMGFMTEETLGQWEENDAEDQFNPFDTQSEFFRMATGVEEPIYTPVEVISQGHTDFEQFPVEKTGYGNYKFRCEDEAVTPVLKWNFEAVEAGMYFVYAKITEGRKVSVTRRTTYESEPVDCGTFNMQRGYIGCIGEVSKGKIISVSTTLPRGQKGTAQVYVNRFNSEAFEKGFGRICKDVMTTTKLSGNRMEGTIEVSEDGMFYTSVPYEKGWSAKVDGKNVEITPVGGALLAFPLEKGSHEIALVFYPRGFWPGLMVTLVSVVLFVLLCLFSGRKRGNKSASPKSGAEVGKTRVRVPRPDRNGRNSE